MSGSQVVGRSQDSGVVPKGPSEVGELQMGGSETPCPSAQGTAQLSL